MEAPTIKTRIERKCSYGSLENKFEICFALKAANVRLVHGYEEDPPLFELDDPLLDDHRCLNSTEMNHRCPKMSHRCLNPMMMVYSRTGAILKRSKALLESH